MSSRLPFRALCWTWVMRQAAGPLHVSRNGRRYRCRSEVHAGRRDITTKPQTRPGRVLKASENEVECPSGSVEHPDKGRYKLFQKLGETDTSTTWLAENLNTAKMVSIDITDAGSDVSFRKTAGHLQSMQSPCHFFPRINHQFTIRSPEGTHSCAVLPALGMSLKVAFQLISYRPCQLETARSLAAQLVLGFHGAHEKGYALGNFNLSDLYIRLPPAGSSEFKRAHTNGASTWERIPVIPVGPRDGQEQEDLIDMPFHGVGNRWFCPLLDVIPPAEAQLVFTGYEQVFRPDERSHFESSGLNEHRPPETYSDPTSPLTFASDIWRLAGLIFHMFGSRPPVYIQDPWDYAQRDLDDEIETALLDQARSQLVVLSGPPPREWWLSWEGRNERFDEAGNLLHPGRIKSCWWGPEWAGKHESMEELGELDCVVGSVEWRIEHCVQQCRRRKGMKVMEEDERAAFLSLLKSMMVWQPGQRPDIQAVLESEWVTKWALPAYRRS